VLLVPAAGVSAPGSAAIDELSGALASTGTGPGAPDDDVAVGIASGGVGDGEAALPAASLRAGSAGVAWPRPLASSTRSGLYAR
jgi:hypothetical protein